MSTSDYRPLALGGCAWTAMWLASSGHPGLLTLGGVGAGALAIASVWRRSWFLAGLALVASSCIGVGALQVWLHGSGPLRQAAESGASGSVSVVLSGESRSWAPTATRPALWVSSGRVVSFEARGSGWDGGGQVTILATGPAADDWAQVPLGTTVSARARLGAPEPGEAIAARVRVREPPTIVLGPGPLSSGVGTVRQGLRDASSPLSPNARALVPALVVGDVTEISAEINEQFKVTALTHIMAVSGSNLVLMLTALRAAAVLLGARGRVLTAVLALGVVGFVAVCLSEPSVVRAAAMGLVGMVALGHGGGPNQGRRTLAVAVWILVLLDPWLARSVGFALSVVASAGLLWWGKPWTDALAGWMPRWVAESVAVPLAAQIATEPIIVALSGRVSLSGVLANVVCAPLVGPATVLGLIAALLAVVWLPAAQLVARGAGVFAEAILRVAHMGSELPGAAVSWPPTPFAVGLVAIACVAAASLMPAVLRRRGVSLLVFAIWLTALTRVPTPPGWPPPEWAVVSCDVGQGDATVFNAGGGSAVIVDAGPDIRALETCLSGLRVKKVPVVFVTHLHADHVTGLPAVATRSPEAVVTSAVETPASGAALVEALQAQRRVAEPGQAWTVGDVRVDVLAVPDPPPENAAGEGESSAENDASLLLRVSVRGMTVLLAGDAEDAGQQRHALLGDALAADVLLVPHHGSSRQSEAFLEKVAPRVALVSAGKGNDYGHPTEKTLGIMRDLGADVVRTDHSGSIAVRAADDGQLLVTTQRRNVGPT